MEFYMKKIIICLTFAFAFTFASKTEACPYQKMAEVDSKLFSDKSDINTETFAKISNLRVQGAEKLEIGELDNAEAIFDKALALLNNN